MPSRLRSYLLTVMVGALALASELAAERPRKPHPQSLMDISAPRPMPEMPNMDALPPVESPCPENIKPNGKAFNIEKAYPPAALKGQIQGWVIADLSIDPQGAPIEVKIVASAPEGIFEEAVAAALARMSHDPPGQVCNLRRQVFFRLY